MAKFVFDIESTGLANSSSIDYSRAGYPLKSSFKIHCIVAQDVDTKHLYCFYDGDYIPVINKKSGARIPYRHFQLAEFKRILDTAESLIGHNIINYDMFILKKYWDINYSIGEQVGIPDRVGDRECFLDDTLIKSKLLNPDRRGGHSLESFGKRLAFPKGDYGKQENAWDVFTPAMLAYCIDDVRLNSLVHDSLLQEWSEHGGWDDAYCLEKAVKELVTRSEQVGFYFDKELAEWCVVDLAKRMDKIQREIEPLLPRKMLPKSDRPSFPSKPFNGKGEIAKIGWEWLADKLGYNVNFEALEAVAPPKTAFKNDGSLSVNGEKYCIKHGVDDPAKMPDFIRSQLKKINNLEPLETEGEYLQALADLRAKKMPDLTTPMTLADQKDLKEYFVRLGWIPQVWSEDDMTLDKKTKRKVSEDQFRKRAQRYTQETLESPFCRFRCEKLKTTPDKLLERLLSHDMKRPLKRFGSPKFTVDLDKTIDPNLLRLGEKVSWVGDVVDWLTWRHRKNSIHSAPNAHKKNWSGWLANKRLEVDSRIPTPADTCGCSTSRFTHIDVANIPRITSPYGEYMRALFGVSEEYYQVGMDFDSLEAKIEAHYCYPYPNGKEYGVSLTAAKPNDIHSVNARKMDVPRGDAKTLKYASSYGAQPPKLAIQMGWTLSKSQAVFDAFWEASAPLAACREDTIKFWKTIGKKKFIIGLDGRKLYARSEHSILNLLFQSAGVICAKRAAVWWDRQVQKEKLEGVEFIIAYHDEQQTQDLKKNVKRRIFDTKEEAEAWKADYESKTNKILSDINHTYDGTDRYVVSWCRSGELAALSCKYASRYYNLHIELSGGYIVGQNWAECH